jgi:hypothetical protein
VREVLSLVRRIQEVDPLFFAVVGGEAVKPRIHPGDGPLRARLLRGPLVGVSSLTEEQLDRPAKKLVSRGRSLRN